MLLTQTGSALPFFVLALPAGAIGDIVDRRKLILFTEVWMAAVAIVLAGVTIGGLLSPGLLLILTFALSAGDGRRKPNMAGCVTGAGCEGRSGSGRSTQRYRI